MAGRASRRPIEVLLVDDNPGDVDLAREGLESGKLKPHLSVAENGVEALAFLRREGRYAGAPRPDLILLDLNLPVKDGRETLREIKEDDDLKDIPVVVLTTSSKDEDVLNSYRLHANCFITKPLLFDQFIKVVQGIEEFWFTTVTLPPRREP
jgi:two-component system response regulator